MKKINNWIYCMSYDIGYLIEYYVFLLVWVDCVDFI